MAQFDLYRNPRRNTFPLLLDIQHELHHRLESRIVVPLLAHHAAARPLTHLTPILTFEGTRYIVVVPSLASVPSAFLGSPVGSLADQRATIIAALDLLFTGS